MRLRPNEFCPIHRSMSCCGRELMPRPKLIRIGVQRIEDPHHRVDIGLTCFGAGTGGFTPFIDGLKNIQNKGQLTGLFHRVP